MTISTLPQPDLVVRASSTNGFADCPRRWAATQMRRELRAAGFELRTTAKTIGAPIGTAVHAGAAATLLTKRESGHLCPEEQAISEALHSFTSEIANFDVLMDELSPTRGVAQAQIIRMTVAYRTHVAVEISPVLIEKRLEAEFAPGIVVSGQQDVLAQEPGRMRDLKAGRRLANCKPQIGCYSLLARTEGYVVDETIQDWVQRQSMRQPQPVPVSIRHDTAAAEAAAVAVLTHIDHAVSVFRYGDGEHDVQPGDPWAFVANPSSMLCSDKYCPAHGTEFCKEWMKK